jgi:pimeloyl-ACP methyl ester carboxylesterase
LFEELKEARMTETASLDSAALASGIRSRFVHDINGLRMHVLEAGFEGRGRPCILLLHGFPELAYSWRKVMVPLASAGFHVVAPDQRGYGRTTGWDADYDGDLNSFRLLNLVRDALGLVSALGHRSVAAVIGHDFGASVAAWCALVRPDVFRSVVLMSAPFAGPPALPFDTAGVAPGGGGTGASAADIHAALAKLERPRKHYQWYYSTRAANADMRDCPQGVHAFLRAYFHHKSADWSRNKPFRLTSWTAGELAKMPTYYIMDLDKDMAATVAPEMPSADEIAACRWLSESELGVYSAEYLRTGFQGGLQWYRCRTGGAQNAELQLFAGRTIDVPSMFIAGKSDWGIYQVPGSIERMQASACTRMQGCHLIEGAGHWVQQEQPQRVSDLLTPFLQEHAGRTSAA